MCSSVYAADETPVAAEDSGALQEIVVTANKRSEDLSKVPISIAAYTREALDASGVKDISSLSQFTPGLQLNNSAGFGPGTLTVISIRGIQSLAGSSTTGVYVDDTPIQGRLTALSYFGNAYPVMFDLQRVEVERGPQGTLFGAGAEGGALRFISPEPSLRQADGYVHGEVAQTQGGALSDEIGVAGGAPLIDDKLGFRASLWYRKDGGYVDRVNPFDGQTVDGNSNYSHSYSGRFALTYAPIDALRITPSIYAQSLNTHDSLAFFEDLSNASDGQFKNGRLLQQPSADRFSIPSLKVDVNFGPVNLIATSSYFERTAHLLDDATSFDGAVFGSYVSYGNPKGLAYPADYSDAGPSPIYLTQRAFTQEVRLASNTPESRLRWTVGAFYSRMTQAETQLVYSAFYATNLFGLPPDAQLYNSTLKSLDKQVAGFGQVDYRVTDKLTVTAGIRVAHTTASFVESQAGPLSSLEFPSSSGEQAETPNTPKVVLTYQLSDNHMVYVSAAKGFRVGGANAPVPLKSDTNPTGCDLPGEPPPYSADSLWSYDIGAKDTFLDGRVRIASSAYLVRWKNIQQQILLATSCGFGYIANTGGATSKGFDIDIQAAVTPAVLLGLSASYTHAFVNQNANAPDGTIIYQRGDAIGSPPAPISPWNLTASVRYSFGVFGGKDGYVRVEDIFRSRNPGPFNTQIPAAVSYDLTIPANPSTNLLNARLGLNLSSQLEMNVFVNNALNSHPLLNRYHETAASELYTDTTLRPRTFGISGTYKF